MTRNFDDDPYDPFSYFTPRERRLHKLAGLLLRVGFSLAVLGIVVIVYSIYYGSY